MKLALLGLAALFLPTQIIPMTGAAHNSQIETEDYGQAVATLTIVNHGLTPKTVYARFEYPWDIGNRNYGFIQTVWPGGKLVYDAPEGTRIYACDGKYWGGFTPKETLVATIENGQSVRFNAKDFKPD